MKLIYIGKRKTQTTSQSAKETTDDQLGQNVCWSEKEVILPYVRKQEHYSPSSVTASSNFSSLLLNKISQQSQVTYSIGLGLFPVRWGILKCNQMQ